MAMTKQMLGAFGVAATVVVGACDDACLKPVGDEVTMRGEQSNGMLINGMLINGMLINGMLINGMLINSPTQPTSYIEMLEFEVKGKEVASSWVVGSEWSAKTESGQVYSGTQLDKSKLLFNVVENGVSTERKVKIRDVSQLSPGSDVWLYDLDVKVGSKAWEPLCVDASGEPTEAIIIEEVWQPTGARLATAPAGALTFACRGAALAKCVEFGYKPWATKNGVSLAEIHQACTRMIRADYCGDGVARTSNGTPVHVLDQMGIQNVEPGVQYAVEAEWGPNGAVCLNSENRRHPEINVGCEIPACGPSFASGGLIQSGKVVQGP